MFSSPNSLKWICRLGAHRTNKGSLWEKAPHNEPKTDKQQTNREAHLRLYPCQLAGFSQPWFLGILSFLGKLRDVCSLPLVMQLPLLAVQVVATSLSLPAQDAITANCIGTFCVRECPVTEHTEGSKTLIIQFALFFHESKETPFCKEQGDKMINTEQPEYNKINLVT